MYRLLFCALLLVTTTAFAEQQTVRVVDTDGNPVPKFEAMYHTSEQGYSHWQEETNGKWTDSFDQYGEVIDLVVRAEGHATTVQRFENAALEKLLKNQGEIRLDQGREIKVQLNLPEGMKIPEGFVLDSYFPQFAWRVHSMWQPSNLSHSGGKAVPWDMLNVQQINEQEYSLRLPTQKSSARENAFFLAIHRPGWLQFCELGPFHDKNLDGDVLRVDVPRPASVDVVFDAGGNQVDELPFNKSTCMVYWAPDESGSVYGVIPEQKAIRIGKPFALTDLGPGRYYVEVRTEPKSKIRDIEGTEINPGRFFTREVVTLKDREKRDVKFSWVPFDKDTVRGNARARITVLNPDDSVPTDKKATVSWWDGHYGQIVAFDGKVPDDGVIALDGVTAKRPGVSSPWGRYTVTVDNERLGFFGLEDTKDTQEFEFRITPGKGDIAPDISLVDVETKDVSKLSDHLGKVVYLEFWTIGCGPCQPEMRKLNNLAKQKAEEWRDKVALVSVSCDREAALVQNHAATRGWSALRHHIGTPSKAESGFSNAETAYVIMGYPTALLIDQSGKIFWRGHPGMFKDEKLTERIESLLAGNNK